MAETIDEQFIEYIVKALVGSPDEVKIKRTIDERGVLLELFVGPDDLGRVIGRNGGTAKSIRTLLRALGVKNDARYNLKIVDTNHGGHSQDESAKPAESTEAAQPAKTSEEVSAGQADVSEPKSEEAKPAEEPTPEPEPAPAEPESSVAGHRKDIEDITKGLDL